MSDIYRVEVSNIVDKGILQMDFDPNLITRLDDMEWIGDWDNDGEYRIAYMYEDENLAKMMYDLGYSFNWNKELPFRNEDQTRSRSHRKGIRLVRRSCVKLRKRRNSSGYTDKSLKAHEDAKEKLKLKYNEDAVTNMYRRLIEDFNKFFADLQMEKVRKAYGNVYSWKVEEDEEYAQLDAELKALEEKRTELEQKRFDRRCQLVLEYVENKVEKIAPVFVEPILQEIGNYKAEGYRSPWLRRS